MARVLWRQQCAQLTLFLFCLLSLAITRTATAGHGFFDLPLRHECAWPFISDADSLNAFYPERNATYWVQPYLSIPGTSLEIHGFYPDARFMSFNCLGEPVKNSTGMNVGAIADQDIAPDEPGNNPFQNPDAKHGQHHRGFTVHVLPQPDEDTVPGPNTIFGPPFGAVAPVPYPVVDDGCRADFETALDTNHFYTYILNPPENRPINLSNHPDVTELPWGDLLTRQKGLILRNMLPDSNFDQTAQEVFTEGCFPTDDNPSIAHAAACAAQIMGEYYPRAIYCDLEVFERVAGKLASLISNPCCLVADSRKMDSCRATLKCLVQH